MGIMKLRDGFIAINAYMALIFMIATGWFITTGIIVTHRLLLGTAHAQKAILNSYRIPQGAGNEEIVEKHRGIVCSRTVQKPHFYFAWKEEHASSK